MQNSNDKAPLSFSELALTLANDYSRLFVIDSQNDSYVEYAPSGSDKELVQVSGGEDFFRDVLRDCREQVWPEDQAMFLKAFRKENITGALEHGQSFSLNYRLNIDGSPRYFFLKAIRGNDYSIVIGVQDVDEQMRRELDSQKASRTYSEIANALASLFEIIYHVDITTGRYTVYSSTESFCRLNLDEDHADFFRNARKDMQRIVHPDDRARMVHELDRDVMLAHLRANGTVSLNYRQIMHGDPEYMNLLAFMLETDEDGAEHLVIGVRNIDAQMKRESESITYAQIAGSLASRYEVIYYIDTDTNAYTQYSASEEYSKLGTTKQGGDFFADAAKDIHAFIHPSDRKAILRQLSRETLLASLEKTGSLSISYRQFLEGRQQYMNMLIVQPKNDQHHIVMGVFNTDEQVRREQSMRAESQTFSDISLALAQRYEAIYHVNIITNEYTEYTASEKYAKLKVGTKGKDFFAETQENMKRDIYPEDLPMMSMSMQKENLLNSLSSFGKTFLSYRLMLDGRAQYVSLYAVRPKEDSKHIIVAVANVDAAKRMELAYQNAVDMANKDALTGVKNKRAYVQAETDLDEQIANNAQPAFALVVCDINGLKEMNDNHGHKAGDDFIRSACTIICNTFKHSPVFRIGGDEFAVIMRGQDYENRLALMEQLGVTLEARKHEGVVLLAKGLSEFNPETDMRVQDVFERADKLMYADKEICKSFGPIR